MSLILHIWGQDAEKRDEFVTILSKTLQNRGYSLVELIEQQAKEDLGLADEILAKVMAWASARLIKAESLVLISVTPSLSQYMSRRSDYRPNLEVSIDGEAMTTASQQLSITAESANLAQETAQVILYLETEALAGQGAPSAEGQANANVYSADEEAAIEKHLRSLGYL